MADPLADQSAHRGPDARKVPLKSIEAIPAMHPGLIAHLSTEVFIPLKSEPGTLAEALGVISEAGYNIEGYAETAGTLHVLTDDSRGARAALEAAGFAPSEAAVVVLPVVDRQGIAPEVFRRIAGAEINVLFSYLATDNRLVIGASDSVRAADELNK